MNKTIRAIGAGLLCAVWLGLSAFAWVKPPEAYSEAERRKLAALPEMKPEGILDGSYMDAFTDYAVDQFPMREGFRSLKAMFAYYGLQQLDNNGYFIRDGYIVKQTYPLEQASVNHAVSALNKVYTTYLADTSCTPYMAIVPDKGYHLSQGLSYPAMDYRGLETQLREKLPWAQHLGILDTLQLQDYYRTDTHWKQECLLPTAQKLCAAMGAEGPEAGDYTQRPLDKEFYGVYYGHGAIPMEPDQLVLLESELLKACTVYDPVMDQTMPLYDLAKLDSNDPYQVYLSGNQPILQISNPNAGSQKELVVFRDSFGSSIAPLLVQGYRTVTLVDIRYISQQMIGNYLEFSDQDVLFLYSTLILNESSTMKR